MVKRGDRVTVHYRGTLKDGSVFDSSEGHEPLVFTLGEGSMIAGFEKGIGGMKIGQTKKFTIPAAQAYGPRQDNLVMVVPKSRLPEGLAVSTGGKIQMRDKHGGTVVVRVVKVTEDAITIDANHELAGEDLTFEVKLVAVT